MRYFVACVLALAASTGPALAQSSCPGHPDAIGLSRTITVDPATLPRIGIMQYHQSLPLNDHEVVLTFDDGPLPPNTERVIAALKANCVTATFFMVGQMASTYPWLAREVYNDGNTIGTHSEHHPLHFDAMGLPRIKSEVDDGIAAVTKALGNPQAVSPFFRIPGLARGKRVEKFLASQKLAVWSADEVADDWHRGISAAAIVRLAIRRIEAHDHRGVLLLHDIHPATARALPVLLKELKERGYHIVQVVAPGARPKALPPFSESPAIARLDHRLQVAAARDATAGAMTTLRHHVKTPLARKYHHHRHSAHARRRHKSHQARKAAHTHYAAVTRRQRKPFWAGLGATFTASARRSAGQRQR